MKLQKWLLAGTLGLWIGIFVLGGCGDGRTSPAETDGGLGAILPVTAKPLESADFAEGQESAGEPLGENSSGASREESGPENLPEASRREESGAESLPGTSHTESNPENPSEASQTQPPEEDQPPTLTLVMVGDILLHTPVAESGRTENGDYQFDALFEQMAEEIREADLALVNQEVILGGTELGISGYPSFNAPYELGDALVNAGFDVVLHATNHALDKRKTGLLNCLSFWKTSYPQIAVLGIHETEEEQERLYVYEQDGIRVAILNYTYGTNGVPLPEDMPFAVDLLEQERVEADLAKADKEADFVIVCPHWGTEYRLEPSEQQEKWTRIFLENGADLVLGTHPHVIEPVEWVSDEQGNEMLVYYSLGNFLNWTSGTGDGVANRMVGGMAKVTLTETDGRVEIADYGVEPVVCHLEKGFGGVTVYPLADYTEELAAANEIRNQDPAFSLTYCRELCQKVWGELYVP